MNTTCSHCARPIDFGPTLYIKQKPLCLAGGTYTLNNIAKKPACTVAGHSLEEQ